MAYVKGAHNGNDAGGASLAATFGSAVGVANLVRGYVTWGTAVLTDLNTVTDDKGNSYTIVDKVADSGNVQSFGSFYLENITNAPTVVTANFLNTPVVRAIVVGEYSGEVVASAIDGHAMILRASPGVGTDAITTGNFTTTVAGDTVTSGIMNTSAGPLTNTVHGTGFGDEESDTVATCDLKTEDLVQGAASATTNGLWTDATNGGSQTYIVGGMAFKALAGGASSAFRLLIDPPAPATPTPFSKAWLQRRYPGAFTISVSVDYVWLPTGGLTFGGTAPVNKGKVYAVSGGLTFGGTAPVNKGKVFVVSGGLVFGGVAATLYTVGAQAFVYTPSGGLVFGGTAPYNKGKVFAVSGGLIFAGTAPWLKGKAYAPSGGLVFGGNAVLLKGKVYVVSGGLTFGGVAPYQFSGTVVVAAISTINSPLNVGTLLNRS